MSVFGTGCTLSGPTVRVPGKVSGMRTGEEEYGNQFVHKISDFGTGCTSSGPTVRVPGELPGM